MAAGLVLGLLMVGSIAAVKTGWTDAAALVETMSARAREAGPAGWLLFAGAQAVVAMVGVIPASLLGIAAGAVYGLAVGFLLAAAGTLLGGFVAFRLARSLLRPWVERLIARRGGGRLAGLDAAVARDGWRFVCLLRISPVMPFALTSYALGLTHITGRNYLLGTLAALPALAGYVGIGALARQGALTVSLASGSGMTMNWLLLGAGVLATAALVLRSGTLLARCGLLPKLPSRAPGPPA